MRSSRQRPDNAASSSRTPSIEREGERPRQALWAEPDDGQQVAVAHDDGGLTGWDRVTLEARC